MVKVEGGEEGRGDLCDTSSDSLSFQFSVFRRGEKKKKWTRCIRRKARELVSSFTFVHLSEMQKATSTASALVLFFSPSCANLCDVYAPDLLNLSIQRRISPVQ